MHNKYLLGNKYFVNKKVEREKADVQRINKRRHKTIKENIENLVISPESLT